MAPNTDPIPPGYHGLIPHVITAEAVRVIEFLKHVFGATEIYRLAGPDGRIMHAELKVRDSVVMVADGSNEWKPMPSSFVLYVENADATYRRAIEAGATSLKEPANQFYGDRSGAVKDMAGNHWWIATRIENVPPEEIKSRAETWMRQQKVC